MPQHASASLATHQRRLLNEIDYSLNTVKTFKSEVAEAKDLLEMTAAVSCHHDNMSSALNKINHSINILLAGSLSACSIATHCDEVHRRRLYNEIDYVMSSLDVMRRNISQAESSQQMNDVQHYYVPVIISAVQALARFDIILKKDALSLARSSNIPIETVRSHLMNQAVYLGKSLMLLRREVAEADNVQDIADSVTHHDKRISPIINELATPAQLQERNEAEEIISSLSTNSRWKPPDKLTHSNSSISAGDNNSEIKSGRERSKNISSSIQTKGNLKRKLEEGGTISSVKEYRNPRNGEMTGSIVTWIARGNKGKHPYGFINAKKTKYYFKQSSLVGENFDLQSNDKNLNIKVTFDIVPKDPNRLNNCDEAVNVRRVVR